MSLIGVDDVGTVRTNQTIKVNFNLSLSVFSCNQCESQTGWVARQCDINCEKCEGHVP
jgi:hypothetical protein